LSFRAPGSKPGVAGRRPAAHGRHRLPVIYRPAAGAGADVNPDNLFGGAVVLLALILQASAAFFTDLRAPARLAQVCATPPAAAAGLGPATLEG
jgi:hypothetical protein